MKRERIEMGPDAAWRQQLANGKFMIQRSAATSLAVFPPRVMAPGDGAQDLDWVEASGRGTVHSFTVVAQKPPSPGYNICLIDLAEGPRVMARLVEVDQAAIAIGMSVESVVETDGDTPVLAFRPVAA